jgi:lipopolysaccharide export system protein LptA
MNKIQFKNNIESKFMKIKSQHTRTIFGLISSIFFIAAFSFISPSYAEKADSLKITNIKAAHYDQAGNILKLQGSVIVTRGSLLITSENAIYQQRDDGSTLVTLTATPSAPVFFRQKRDKGTDLWMEGNANRVEYDSKTEVVKLIDKASVRYLDGKIVTQSQEGDYLSYDNVNDIANGKSVSITIEPKTIKPESK